MSIELTRKGWKWFAKFGEQVFEGTTPESAIRKLTDEHPEESSADVTYKTVDMHARQHAVMDTEHCPVCGKVVVYANANRPNGRFALLAFHEGELPPEAQVADVKPEYKKWLLKETLHLELKEPGKIHSIMIAKPKKEKPKKAEKVESTEPEVQASEITVPVKEKVILEPLVTIGSTMDSMDAVPQNAPDALAVALLEDNSKKPIVDITGMKHNRFQMVGAVLKALKEAGWTDDRIKVARSDLTENGKDTVAIIHVANQYAIVHENGLPIVMDSGLVAPA